MQQIPCLLDVQNELVVEGLSVGQRIRAQKHACLWEDRRSSLIDTVIIHYISAEGVFPQDPFSFSAILKIFCDYGVSAHFLIDRQGTVFSLVPPHKKAWHCGGSIMPLPDLRTGVNDFSIGIELVATALSGFTDAQYGSLGQLCNQLQSSQAQPLSYWGHEDVAGEKAFAMGLRADVKLDPGPLFDWSRLAPLLGKTSAGTVALQGRI